MAVIEIIEEGGTTALVTTEVGGVSEIPLEVAVVEVLAGAPGVQNLYVGPTPPDSPQEDWIWVDTS